MSGEEIRTRKRRLIDALLGNVSPEERARNSVQKVVLAQPAGHLWHTTNPERFEGILATGAILPKPDISYMKNWKTLGGTDYCPYARKIGGVSLFDFDGFDPELYSANYRNSSWYTYVPYCEDWGVAVWIEIDREAIAAQFISCADLVASWKIDKAERHAIMPNLEAAHIGRIRKAFFKRAFIASRGGITAIPL